MRFSCLLLALLILAICSSVQGQELRILSRDWGEEQATGPPNTREAGDIPTAWASATADGQDEWLELEYAAEIEPVTVLVYESFNPGALTRVCAFTESGMEAELWAGRDPTEQSAGIGVSEVEVTRRMKTRRIRLYLDSKDVPGWNEIDAVGLRDKEGKTHWAVAATASSCYAARRSTSLVEAIADAVPSGFLPRVRLIDEIVVPEEEEEAVREVEIPDLLPPARDPRDERIEALEEQVRELRDTVEMLRAALEESKQSR